MATRRRDISETGEKNDNISLKRNGFNLNATEKENQINVGTNGYISGKANGHIKVY